MKVNLKEMVRAHSVNILIISYKDIIYYKGLWVTFKKPKYIIQGMIKNEYF